MDNKIFETAKNSNSDLKARIFNKKTIFSVFCVVIALEAIWALWSVFKPLPVQVVVRTKTQMVKVPTEITLESTKTQLKAGDKVTVSINISSDKLSDGTDIIISYDPKLLSVNSVGREKAPVIVGTIYSDYPINKLDPILGKVTLSGVSSTKTGVNPSGLLGSILFQAKVAGNAKISIDFTPGSTSDTNISETGTGKDILEKVNGLQLNILP